MLNSLYKENAYFMDIQKFGHFLGMNNDEIAEITKIEELILKAVNGDNDALLKLEQLSDEAMYRLKRDGCIF